MHDKHQHTHTSDATSQQWDITVHDVTSAKELKLMSSCSCQTDEQLQLYNEQLQLYNDSFECGKQFEAFMCLCCLLFHGNPVLSLTNDDLFANLSHIHV